ncbi:beta-lactamase/transpeptidase-like protein [Auricularia subglabra TFB-10046 SS5]|nr:beta-lactamase/transpeptidase-like protein [Auricularia subglabra TFB-10046 SS5]
MGAQHSGLLLLPLLALTTSAAISDTERFSCRPFLPTLFVDNPPAANNLVIKNATGTLDRYLSQRFASGNGDIDALSVAVITSEGAVFEKNWGVTRGNETKTSPKVTSQSSYRIASVSKLALVYEAFILQQKGALEWDDPVEKYIPSFKYRPGAFAPNPVHQDLPQEQAPITIFQLASHLSGMGRDWPSGTVANWPHDLNGAGSPPINGLGFPDYQGLLDAIARTRLTNPPNTYPQYSNTATGFMGMVLVAANKKKFGPREPSTYGELVQRDIFGPLGMTGSHFLTTPANKKNVVVASFQPETADQDFLDALNPAGGQFSSLSDFIKLFKVILNPRRPESKLTPYSMARWMQSVHAFEEDDWTEIGLIWEIIKHQDSNERLRKIYFKLGEMAGYHIAVGFHPGSSYAVLVLMAGHYNDATKLAYDAFDILQPAFDKALAQAATSAYVGTWGSGNNTVTISINRGTLYVDKFLLQGVNVLGNFFADRLALRPTQRAEEFRLDTGIPGYNGKKHMGCYVYWNGIDFWGLRNDAPINLLYFATDRLGRRELHIPSTNTTLQLKRYGPF